MKTAAHTQKPWEVREVPSRERIEITDSTGYTIAEMPSYPSIEREAANAAFIVRAVNSHEKLKHALSVLHEYTLVTDRLLPPDMKGFLGCELDRICEEALALAEAE